MQGLSVMLGMWSTSPSFSQLASVPVGDSGKVEKQAEDTNVRETMITTRQRCLKLLKHLLF